MRGFPIKRMKGLEPSTFCMASRRSSQLSYIRGVDVSIANATGFVRGSGTEVVRAGERVGATS